MCNLSNAEALEAYGYDVVDLGNGWLDVTYIDDFAGYDQRLTMQIEDDPAAVANFLAGALTPNTIAGPAWPQERDSWPAEFTVELGPTE